MENRILLMRTGGTLDAEPYDDPRNPPRIVSALPKEQSILGNVLGEIPYNNLVDIHHWTPTQEKRFVKDSQQYTSEDIHELAQIIMADPHQYFLLPHGTDHMCRNAAMLQEELKGTNKGIVFVGAMVPLSMNYKHGSDGPDVMEYAIDQLTCNFDVRLSEKPIAPGVFVVARDPNTKRFGFFDPSKVEKDREVSKANLSFTVRH